MTKYLFIDRDGTLVREPEDFQVDAINKIRLVDHVIPSLLRLKDGGYRFVMVTNQDGLGTASFPQESFQRAHDFILALFSSQGITFDDILVCPHLPDASCECRKPRVGLVLPYLQRTDWNRPASYVIGDRKTDLELAHNMGLKSFLVDDGQNQGISWNEITVQILDQPRRAAVKRQTKETHIDIAVQLEGNGQADVSTGIGFFDHMLEQLAKHSGMDITISCQGDLHIDAHHTIEDVALALGQCLRESLGDKRGVGRYGFVIPMDEAQAHVAIDLSGRPFFRFEGTVPGDQVGAFPVAMFPHFFRSLSETLQATLHLRVSGENAHHIIESSFKALARALGQAIRKEGKEIPSTKGVL